MSRIADVTSEESLSTQVAVLQTLQDYLVWEYQCNALIESLGEQTRSKRMRLPMGYRHSVSAQILRLECLKQATRIRFIHTGEGFTSHRLVWREIDTAFDNRLSTGAVINSDHIDPRQFLLDSYELVAKQVTTYIEKYGSIKVNAEFNGEFAVGEKRANKSINTGNVELFTASDLSEWYQKRVVEPILKSLEEFQESDSGWNLAVISNLAININKYNAMRAGCHIALSRRIFMKKAVINVKSSDNACFGWAMVAALYPATQHSDRTSAYPHYSTVFNLDGIKFPMTLDQISRFEKMNNLSINIYTERKDIVLPVRVSKDKKPRHVNLLYIEDAVGCKIGHFAWIKNLSRLVNSQLSVNEHKKYICDR